MGIPRLTSLLEPFQHRTTLGCSNASCSRRPKSAQKPQSAVIDGPGLAYWIYYKLIGRNDASSAFEAQPSYRELGAAVVSSLQFFEACGVDVRHIFFDGALPESKRDTRVKRLTDTLSKLNLYRSVHPNGFKAGTAKNLKIRPEEMFHPWTLPAFTKNFPSSPFLVSAVFEALKASEFADRTQLVPGEADEFLAAATRLSRNHLCLTGDSDLAIHNLGSGDMAFFTSLEALSCSTCNHGHILVAKLLRQEELLAKLGSDAKAQDLVDLGFELYKDYTLGFDEIVRRIKAKASAASKARSIGWTEDLDEFARDYTHPIELDALSRIPIWCQQLDNRTSELAVQALSNLTKPLHSYLLSMIEDPERGSAWAPSRQIRQLAYSVLIFRTACKAESVIEIGRSGRRIIETQVPMLSQDQTSSESTMMEEELQQIKKAIGNALPPAYVWIVFAAMRTYRWYLDDEKTPPGADLVQSALGKHKAGKLTWQSIHLRAQIHGFLFSMRLLNQMLTAPAGETRCQTLRTPTPEVVPIQDIILTNSELAATGLAQHTALIIDMARTDYREDTDIDAEVAQEDPERVSTVTPSEHWKPVTSKTKKKAKRKRAEEAREPRQNKANQNPFDLLR